MSVRKYLFIEEKEEDFKKPKRISPQLSCTLEEKDKLFLESMALHFSNKKKKVFTISETLRIILGYCKKNEYEVKNEI